jgi:hypothetical protein
MKTVKLLKNKGKYLIQLRTTMKNFIRRKKQMKFDQKNIFLIQNTVVNKTLKLHCNSYYRYP